MYLLHSPSGDVECFTLRSMTLSEKIYKVIPQDKLLHFAIAYGAALTAGLFVYWLPLVVGAALITLKEAIDKHQYGLWDWKDFLWGAIGTALAATMWFMKHFLFSQKIIDACNEFNDNTILFYA